MKITKRKIISLVVIACLIVGIFAFTSQTFANPTTIDERFDYMYYANTYPDLQNAFGYDQAKLWNHYVEYGQYECRKCYEGDVGGTIIVNTDGTTSTYEHSTFELEMLRQINEYRTQNGVPALSLHQYCSEVAKIRAVECNGIHIRPNGTKFSTVYNDLGYRNEFNRVSENVYSSLVLVQYDYNTNETSIATNAMNAFKNSSSHNAAMLSTSYQYVGFDYYCVQDGAFTQIYVVQEFAQQK